MLSVTMPHCFLTELLSESACIYRLAPDLISPLQYANLLDLCQTTATNITTPPNIFSATSKAPSAMALFTATQMITFPYSVLLQIQTGLCLRAKNLYLAMSFYAEADLLLGLQNNRPSSPSHHVKPSILLALTAHASCLASLAI